jgi:hypothetical protein
VDLLRIATARLPATITLAPGTGAPLGSATIPVTPLSAAPAHVGAITKPASDIPIKPAALRKLRFIN